MKRRLGLWGAAVALAGVAIVVAMRSTAPTTPGVPLPSSPAVTSAPEPEPGPPATATATATEEPAIVDSAAAPLDSGDPAATATFDAGPPRKRWEGRRGLPHVRVNGQPDDDGR